MSCGCAASASQARRDAEMEKLVGQEIRCRIIKLDVADEDVVVDRRVLEEEERANGISVTPKSRKARPCTAPFAA
jgi:ribosomal protein S1